MNFDVKDILLNFQKELQILLQQDDCDTTLDYFAERTLGISEIFNELIVKDKKAQVVEVSSQLGIKKGKGIERNVELTEKKLGYKDIFLLN